MSRETLRSRWPLVLVAVAVAWNLVWLWPQTRAVAYLNDGSVHEQMVRFATAQFDSGRLPLTSWFPYLGLGSPQFLHYQSLGAMITGAFGLLTGGSAAYRWSLYLLMASWPVSLYLSARLFGFSRPVGAAAALFSPFVMGPVGVGYEQRAYLWIGYGVWAQLWASWTLPIAWGATWRVLRAGHGYFLAIASIAATVALHFETGYLALLPLVLWPLVSGRPVWAYVRRAAIVLAGTVLACAWVIVPLIDQRPWAATHEILTRTPLVNGYGIGRVLSWVLDGAMLDSGRLPVLSVLAGVGLLVALRNLREPRERALLSVLLGCLLLSCGRATFGALVDLVPGSADIFFRRFMMGVQLAGLLLAGEGAVWLGHGERTVHRRSAPRRVLGWTVAAAGTAAILVPGVIQNIGVYRHNTRDIDAQRRFEAVQRPQLGRLLALVRRSPYGRVYAGLPTNWGARFRVGFVPVFKYLESQDIDEVGYTLRTASLMTNPEYYFDESNAGDYGLFGISYMILPTGQRPPVPARLIATSGAYALWRAPSSGYFGIGEFVATGSADRTNVGARSVPLLQSRLPGSHAYLRIRWHGGGGRWPLPRADSRPSNGRVLTEAISLGAGRFAAEVRMRRAGTVVLSSSFDPGWRVTVDGHPRRVLVVAPAIIGARVGRGDHRVDFRYVGYGGYVPLGVLLALSLGGAVLADVRLRRGRRRAADGPCRDGRATRQ